LTGREFVKAGQPLFSIDARNYRAAVAQDEASVARRALRSRRSSKA
jgi:multidrug resistance efflux pump